MTLQLPVSYETIIELALQMPLEQRQALLQLLIEQNQKPRAQTAEERLGLLRRMAINAGGPIDPSYSDRREDWYDDGGR